MGGNGERPSGVEGEASVVEGFLLANIGKGDYDSGNDKLEENSDKGEKAVGGPKGPGTTVRDALTEKRALWEGPESGQS